MLIIITDTNLDFPEIFYMIAMIVMWVLGFKSICMPGNIFHPFQKLIELKYEKVLQHDKEVCEALDEHIVASMPKGYERRAVDSSDLFAIVEKLLKDVNAVGGDDYNYKIHLIDNLQSHCYKLRPNKYYYQETRYRLPYFIRKPLISCATCMPSIHGLLVYSVFGYYKNWFFNPIEWIFLAICSAFFTGFIWKIREKLFQKPPNP